MMNVLDGPQAPGPVLKGWQSEHVLGHGSSSTVWLVASIPHDPLSPKKSALKIPRPAVSGEDSAATTHRLVSAREEARLSQQMNHEHVARFLKEVETDQGPGFLWAYYPGGSLAQLIQASGPLSLGQTVTLLVPTAQAVQHAHTRGIIHGDISPGNVLFDVKARPILSDFGAARVLAGSRYYTGTRGFCAPELEFAEDSTALLPEADVFALGALGWFALTGRMPARAQDRVPLSVLLPGIEPSVVELLESAMEDAPSLRPSLDEFIRACYDWCVPEPLDLHGAVPIEVALQLPTRNPMSDHVLNPSQRKRKKTTRRQKKISQNPRTKQRLKNHHRDTPAGQRIDNSALDARSRLGPAKQRLFIGMLSLVIGSVLIGAGISVDDGETKSSAASATQKSDTHDQNVDRASDVLWEENVRTAVDSLVKQRTQALTERRADLVATYSSPGSEVFNADSEMIHLLLNHAWHFDTLTLNSRILSGPERIDKNRAEMVIEWQIEGYSTVDHHGEVIEYHPASPKEQLILKMDLVGEDWLVESVMPLEESLDEHSNGTEVADG